MHKLFEALESRELLSVSVGNAEQIVAHQVVAAVVVGSDAQDSRRYRFEAMAQELKVNAAEPAKASGEAAAQAFFDQFSARYTPYVAPPVTPVTPGGTTAAISATTRNLVSYNQFVVTGTTGNDSIVVSQSGSTLTIVANGKTTTTAINFAELLINGGDGNDTITVNSSVTLQCLLYGGAGTDTIRALGSGKATIVTIGGSRDTVQGNGVNTSFWVDSTDALTASSAEQAAGDVHVVSSFLQPFGTSSPVSLELNGQNLKDPTDSGATTQLTNRSLWGTAPTMADINQGGLGDCYYLATLQSLAQQQPAKLREMAVDLGDGTYAVQFKSGNSYVYVRVDGDLAGTGSSLRYARPGASGDLWAPIMEKAYAYFRTHANTYASLNGGWMSDVFTDLGVANRNVSQTGDAATVFNSITTALASGKAYTVGSNSTVTGGAPVVGNHAYSVVSTAKTGTTMTVTLRNPWGVDGVSNSSYMGDGLVTLTMAQFQANFVYGALTA